MAAVARKPRVLVVWAPWDGTVQNVERISDALRRAGAEPQFVSLNQLTASITGDRLEIELDGEPMRLPDAVISRASEELWLDVEPLLVAFRELGVWIVNGDGIWVAADKWKTSLALRRAGLPVVPSTYVPPHGLIRPGPATTAARQAGVDVSVVKSRFGANGHQIQWVRGEQSASSGLLLEPYACHPDRMQRVFVARGTARLAQHRLTGHPLKPSNLRQGAKSRLAKLTPAVAEIAEAACSAVGVTAWAGVDVAEWLNGPQVVAPAGVALLDDVNAAMGLQSLHEIAPEIDIYRVFAEAAMDDIAEHR